MKKLLLLFLICVSYDLNAQVWLEYSIPTGITTNINFTSTSTLNSDYKSGNRGVLFDNASADTLRSFFPLDIINDANAYPYRTTVKIDNVTGILIDPYHVLTAGHVITFSPYFGTIKIIPGYNNGYQPYNYAYPEKVYLLSNFSVGTNTDIGIIKLDRPLGVSSGWNGFGYNNTDNFFTSTNFNNPCYPSADVFNGEEMYNWTGRFDYVASDALYSYRIGITGMSGSGAFTKVNGNNIVYGIVTNAGIKFNRITPYLFDAINSILDVNTPTSFNVLPLNADVYPKTLKNGNAPDSISFVIHNYSAENKNNANITASIYLSADSIVTTDDELIGTYNYILNINAKSSVKMNQFNSLPVINNSNGYYWIGIKITGDGTNSNSITKNFDISKIEIINSDKYKISGKITSTQTQNGTGGVLLNGFPKPVVTDFKGYYECYVPSGWSGNVIIQKEGFDFNTPSTTYNNVTSNILTNYLSSKRTFILNGNIKSPVAQNPVSGVKISNLIGEPMTNAAGYYSTAVYYGWSGYATPSKGLWYIFPNLFSYSKVTASKTETMSAGFYIKGYVYNSMGIGIKNVSMDGFPQGNIKTDSTGNYYSYLDSGWAGTVTPNLSGYQFLPASMNYSNLNNCYSYRNYYDSRRVTVNLKIILSGCYVQGTDTMSTILNRKNLLPLTPPDSFSNKSTAFIYKKKSTDFVSSVFFSNHRYLVDWIIIELRNNNNQSIDTVSALLRNDGRIVSISGDTLVPFSARVPQGNYYIIIRHRNHIAVMTNNPVILTYSSSLYDFTTGTIQYYGNNAKQLKPNFYGMFCGDADYNGSVTASDFNKYDIDIKNARNGYINTDFNLDSYITGSDFNIFAPTKRNGIITNIP